MCREKGARWTVHQIPLHAQVKSCFCFLAAQVPWPKRKRYSGGAHEIDLKFDHGMSCFINLDLQVQCEFGIAGRLDVEPKLDIAHYHLIQLYINLMNFLAVTTFLATDPEVLVVAFVVVTYFLKTRKTTARFVLVDDKFGALTRLVQGMQIHCTPKMKKTQLCTNT